MWSAGVIEVPPILQQHLGVLSGIEDLLIETLGSKAGMEAFSEAVLGSLHDWEIFVR